MQKIYQALDPLQLIGFAISFAIPLLLLATGQDQINSVTLGFILATFTQLIDLQVRQDDAVKRLLSSHRMNGFLYKDEWLLECLTQIVSDYQNIQEYTSDPFDFKVRTRTCLKRAQEKIGHMSSGYALPDERIPFEQSSIALRKAQTQVKAADCAIDLDIWSDANARKYVEINKEAKRRGITITRVFIYPIANLGKKVDILKEQRNCGVEVYVVDPSRGLPHALSQDYVIIDDAFAVTSQFGSNGQVTGNKLMIERREISLLLQNFNRLLNCAFTLDEVLSELANTHKTP